MVDQLLLYFEANNASFVGVILFMIMTQYLALCILKGSFSFGVSIPYVFSFHPMGEGRTWMNSFLFNLSISVLGSMAISHLCAGCFPQYLRGTDIQAILINQVTYLKFFNIFFKNKVFIYAFLVLFITNADLECTHQYFHYHQRSTKARVAQANWGETQEAENATYVNWDAVFEGGPSKDW
jgi:hypothetical protein